MATNNKKKVAAKKTAPTKSAPKKQEKKAPVAKKPAPTKKVEVKKEVAKEVAKKEAVKEIKKEETKVETPEIVETKVEEVKEEKKESRPKKTVDASTLEKEELVKKVAKGTNKAIQKAIDSNPDVRNGKPNEKQKKILFISAIVSSLFIFAFLFVPFSNDINPLFFLTKEYSAMGNYAPVIIAIFAVFTIITVIDIYLLINTYMHYKSDLFESKVSRIYTLNFVISILYGLGSLGFFIAMTMSQQTNSLSYGIILTVLEGLVLIFNAVIKSYYIKDYVFIDKDVTLDENNEPVVNSGGEIKSFTRPFPSGELLFYMLIFSLLPVAIMFVNLFKVTANGETIRASIRGIDFFLKLNSLTNIGFKIVAFLMLVFFVADGVLLLTSFMLFFAKRKTFYKVCAASLVVNFVFVLFVTLYGLYYKIVWASSAEKIKELLGAFLPEVVVEELDSVTVETQSYYIAIGAIVLLIVALVRNPSRHALAYEQLDEQELMDRRFNAPKVCDESITDFINDYDVLGLDEKNGKGGNGTAETDEENPLDVKLVEEQQEEDVYLEKFDACPAFTELDNKVDEYNAILENRAKFEFTDATLPSLVKFIVNYAKNSRLHLSYCREDIAAFIAGLGCTRLTILQGMSGTGKTSLPKIFMEAIYGNCELIEIESSWREKNELLGFYNEFSKMYTPKKFTQRLYKAALNPEVITFIVLDEMNLSRIEYYFSDFLSLMENEEENRKIKLSNVKLYNIYGGTRHSYLKLEEEHTLKVPSNVWFIGTANRDESTFEISDKVYDRAHTMNFNKRAPAIVEFADPMNPRFLRYNALNKLFQGAIKSYKFDIEKNQIIKRVEELMAPFNISFGNRIYKQITEFVKVYCSCFDNPSVHEFEAVETILLTKVVMKLENKNIDNRDFLINEFKKLKLTRCVEFISKLSEDF